jgi:glyoxylase-like metal-dependent hydrolase (beta-lactamase superfamily II)
MPWRTSSQTECRRGDERPPATDQPCYAPRAVTLARRGRVVRFALPAAIALALGVIAGAQTSQTAPASPLEVLEVRPNIFMITGAGGNIAVQTADDGVVVVDAGSRTSASAVVDAIKRISPKPIRYIIDTGPDADHVGGNEALSRAGDMFFPGTRAPGARPDPTRAVATILASEGVALHMSASESASTGSVAGLPTDTFHYARKYLYLNGEAIEVLHQPAAHTDSDVFVFFRRSDVVAAGDIVDTRHFPIIDVERGASIDGEIAALNRLAELAVPSVPIVTREAGTLVIPGHGRLYDHYDVVEYRDMVTIIRDRVRDLVKGGKSLDQVKAATPAAGYSGRYGNAGGDWTTDKFVEAVYRSITKEKP